MPPAKGKAAKGRAEGSIDAEEARHVLQLLSVGAAPPPETLHKVFRLNAGPCSASCGKGGKGSRDNPCCFHGLLPAGGFRKKGLWQKEPVLGQLGHDPSDDRRQAATAPAGLRNLGNTCYVNAALQFLHSLPAFRNALYQLEPELADQQIVKQMRDLFIEMHFGPKRYVDPEPFANSLLLDHAIQQDGQEFLKLLLSKLEVVFGASQREDVSSVVQDLFQGHLSHVTTCHTCQQPSEGSKREVEFYELSLQVQQMPSLHHCLVAALAPDELVGDNQYFCDYCAAKSDADRRMRLRSLPPYLCLALQRFTYDQQTWQKKKVLHKLSIPLRLDMGAVLQDAGLGPEAAPLGPDKQPVLPGSPHCAYELAAVLIHKGTSASHGHYVAHIKLHDTGTWWRFDDEEAVEMGLQPTSHPQDHGTTAAAAAAATSASAAAAVGAGEGSRSADEDSKPAAAAAAGKKRGRSAGSGAGSSAERSKGYARGGRGGRKGKRGGKKEPWEEESDAEAEAAAAAAAEAAAQDPEDPEEQLQQALRLSLVEAGCNGDVPVSEAELQATVEAAAGAAAQGTGSRGRRRGQAAAAASRGRGRSRRPAKGAPAAAADTDAGAAGTEPNGEDAAAAAAAEQAGALPGALVEQIMSANAYFLVYRAVASIQLAPGANAAAAAAMVQPATAAAAAEVPAAAAAAPPAAQQAAVSEAKQLPQTAVEPLQQPDRQQQQQQEQQQERPLQAVDQNVQPAQPPDAPSAGVKPEPGAAQAAEQQQQQQQSVAASEQQLPLAAQQLQAQLQQLPEAVQQQVAQLHREFEEACDKFQRRKQEALEAVERRRQEVRSVSELLPVPEGCDDGCFLSLNWLDGWVNSDGQPDPIDNSVLLCQQHGKLNPLLPAGTFKYITGAAWEQLTALHKGGPRQSCSDVCVACLQQLLQGLVSSDDLVGLREQVLAALDADEARQEELGDAATSFYVSKTWVAGFKRRTSGSSGRLEPPTAGIACPHGSLAPEGRSGSAKRFAVSPGTWSLMRRLWPQQVLWEVQAKRDKDARAKAKKAAAGGVDAADAAVLADGTKDDAIEIVDSPKKDKQPQQQEEQQQQDDVLIVDDGDVIMADADAPQQQPDSTACRAASPTAGDDAAASAAAVPSGWQLPFLLDDPAVPLSEGLLLQHLPEYQLSSAYDCEVCSANLQEAAAGHQEVRQQLEGQRQALGKLLAGSVTEVLEQGATYYLVPNSWLDTWRKHMHAALSKKLVAVAQLPPAPEPLPQAIRALMCKCHPAEQPLLGVPLPVVVNKRGRFSQADPQKDALRVVAQHEWQELLLHHSGLEADAGADAALAAAAPHEAHPAAGSRSRRRSGKAAGAQQHQGDAQQQLLVQEERQVQQQRIASMADTDAAFRGIRAWLKVAAPDTLGQQQAQLQEQLRQQPERRQLGNGGAVELQQGAGQLQAQQQPGEAAHHKPPMGGVSNGLAQPEQGHDGQRATEPATNGVDTAEPQQRAHVNGIPASLDAAPEPAAGGDAEVANPSPARRSKRQRSCLPVLDLSVSPRAPPVADAEVVLVESVDLAAEQPSPAAAAAVRAAAEAMGCADDDVQVVTADAALNGGADTSAGFGGSRRLRQPAQQAAAARAAAAARLQRPVRMASAGVAAVTAVEAAAEGLDGASSDGEAVAVAAAAAAASALLGWLETEPGLCEATLQEEAAARRAATLVYDDAELMVELVAEEELQAAASTAAAGERRSRRARKNRQPVKACSTDTLAMLRLSVFQALSVHPKNQRLYVRGQLLEGEDCTLAKLEIFPDEEIRLVNANQVPDDDYASVFDGVAGGKRKAREVETGFKDTALHGTTLPAAPAAAAAGGDNVDGVQAESDARQ